MAREKLGPMDAKIGRHLRRLRLEAGFTEDQVAQELDVTQQMVDRQEHGRSRLSVGQLLRLATFYGRTLAELMAELALDHSALREAKEPDLPHYETDLVTHTMAPAAILLESRFSSISRNCAIT